jgi:class 3 adenylate cyclase
MASVVGPRNTLAAGRITTVAEVHCRPNKGPAKNRIVNQKQGDSFFRSVSREIRRSRRPVTILFTDVEDSTGYWDRHGDIKGRLMVDRHNRLVFPVIRRYRGKIVKTIGDAVMASFRHPENALRAAIGIQQALQKARDEDRAFRLRVRVGIHTGQAIVEQKDVFGDAVNVASRIEGRGKADEIMVSGATAQRVKQSDFFLEKRGTFTPKGKKRTVALYRCRWQAAPDFLDTVQFQSFLPLVPSQRVELLIYAAATVGTLYFLYLHYLRYFIADSERLNLLALDPSRILNVHPLAPVALTALVSAVIIALGRASKMPHAILRILKGGFGFSLIFFLFFLPAQFVHPGPVRYWNGVLVESHHLFVEALDGGANVLAAPDGKAKTLRALDPGGLLLLADVARKDGVEWNRVLIGRDNYGWVPRVIPATLGVPERRISLAYKFYFRYSDLYALLLGFAGFIWGAFNFRVRPV